MTTITIDRAVLEQALEIIDLHMYMNAYCGLEVSKHHAQTAIDAIEGLREALNAPQPKPVAFYNFQTHRMRWAKPTLYPEILSVDVPELTLYAAPPRREWVSLTDEEIYRISYDDDRAGPVYFARDIEAALKERNT